LADYRVPTGITGGNALRRNGGQALEAGLRAAQICFGARAGEGVQRRRRDAIERVVQFGDTSPIGVGEGRRAAVLPGDAGFHVIARQLVPRLMAGISRSFFREPFFPYARVRTEVDT